MKRYVLLYQKRNNFTTSQRKFSYPQNMYNHAKVASLVAQLVKNLPAMQKTLVQFLSQKDPLKKGQATHSRILGLPCGSAGKESVFNGGDLGSRPGLGRSPGEGKGCPLQYSGLRIPWTVWSMGSKNSDTIERLSLHMLRSEASQSKNSIPKLFNIIKQYVCLEKSGKQTLSLYFSLSIHKPRLDFTSVIGNSQFLKSDFG